MRLNNVSNVLLVACNVLKLSVCNGSQQYKEIKKKFDVVSQLANEFRTEKIVLDAFLGWDNDDHQPCDTISECSKKRIPHKMASTQPVKYRRQRRWFGERQEVLIPVANENNDQLKQLEKSRHQRRLLQDNEMGYNKTIRIPSDGPTRLLDEATIDRAKLEQHYRQLEMAATSSTMLKKTSNNTSSKTKKKRLQGVGVRGRLVCGQHPLANTKIKLVDVDPKPDRDDLMAETRTDDSGLFHLSGATREDTDIEVIMKVYHDCLDEDQDCQRKVTWRVPPRYENNGTLTEWFDIGTVNMELGFIGEERDCRH